jgi:hypothetical protein
MLDFDTDALGTAFERSIRGKRIGGRLHPRGVVGLIRVLALLHVVLVTTGTMDSSWAMAKSLAVSHPPITKEVG